PLDPALKLRRVRNKEPLQQVAAVKREGLGMPSRIELRFERCCVAPDHVATEADFAVAARRDRLVTQRRAQHVEGLVQRRTRMRCIRLGPEESQQGVSAVGTAWAGG